MKEIAVVVGTRPEAVKMAPVILELERHPAFEARVVATGQHRELLAQVFEHFGITPDVNLDIMERGQSLTQIAVRALSGLESAIRDMAPDFVLVHGDTSTTLMGALASFYLGVPCGHVEAGLRSFNLAQPFPEEGNRRLVSQIAAAHFAPTGLARENLLREGVSDEAIFVTGNTAIDALRMLSPERRERPQEDLILVECHRRENLGEPHRQSFLGLRDALAAHPSAKAAVSVHPNPSLRQVVMETLGDHPRVTLLEPPPYPEWVRLLARSTILVTDSGGAQEEAPALGVPVVLLRRTTERPEAVAAGTVWRVDPERERVAAAIGRLLSDGALYDGMSSATNPYGDGHAAKRTVAGLAHIMGLDPQRPEPFQTS